MSTIVTHESNGLHVEDLSPKLQEFVREGKIINRLGQDFCCKDFPELGDSLFRQRIFKLRKLGWIVTTCRGWAKIRKNGLRFGKPS